MEEWKHRLVSNFIIELDIGQSWSAESELNEFEPRIESAKNRFQLSAGLNLETLNTILSGAASQI